MNMLTKGAAKRLILSLLLATGLGGCAVYDPYPYGSYPYGYGYTAPAYGYAPPVYAGPPVTLGLGLGFYEFRGGHGGRHFDGHGGFRGGHRGFHGGHGGFRGGFRGRR